MGLISKIAKIITRPLRSKIHGIQGERRVKRALNPLIFGRVKHKQINNLTLVDEQGKTHQVDHIEIRENGIFCIETKNYIGWIFGQENSEKWTQTLYNGEKNHFLNPIKQNKSHCYHISNVIGRNYIVNSLVVMANNNADRINCENVVNVNQLRSYLKTFYNGVHLSDEEMNILYRKLMDSSIKIRNRQHVKNIKKTKQQLSQNICPRCGGSLVLREGKNGTFYGCSNYPKCKFTKRA